jgi:hypothetical protein
VFLCVIVLVLYFRIPQVLGIRFFIPNNNVLVAFKTLHHMHSTKIGRDGVMALKLDMSKAYD